MLPGLKLPGLKLSASGEVAGETGEKGPVVRLRFGLENGLAPAPAATAPWPTGGGSGPNGGVCPPSCGGLAPCVAGCGCGSGGAAA